MLRAHAAIVLLLAVIGMAGVPAGAAPTDPFASPGGAAGDSSAAAESGAAEGSSAATGVAPAAPPGASPACEYLTQPTCDGENTGLLLKSGAYVFLAVLLFSLLRVWWDRRGTNTAGVRFVATLLPAAGAAGALAYLDPARSERLACCLGSAMFKSEILLQDASIARAALLGFVPAALAFVLVAVVLRIVKG